MPPSDILEDVLVLPKVRCENLQEYKTNRGNKVNTHKRYIVLIKREGLRKAVLDPPAGGTQPLECRTAVTSALLSPYRVCGGV